MHDHTGDVQLRPVGLRAALVDVTDARAAAALALWARRHGVEALEVVPAATTVLFDGVDDLGALRALLATAERDDALTSGELTGGDPVEVPVVLDGPDLGWVAEHWGVDETEVVRRLAATELVSAFCGFAPGFAYLAGLPAALAVPRLASPRPRVPAGSVALADTWCGIYPTASPGGWRVVGRTAAVLWDAHREPPALLAPGTRVRLVAS